jgi:hypothetical protein
MDGQGGADIGSQVLLLRAAARLSELLKQIFDLPVVRLEQGNRIDCPVLTGPVAMRSSLRRNGHN